MPSIEKGGNDLGKGWRGGGGGGSADLGKKLRLMGPDRDGCGKKRGRTSWSRNRTTMAGEEGKEFSQQDGRRRRRHNGGGKNICWERGIGFEFESGSLKISK